MFLFNKRRKEVDMKIEQLYRVVGAMSLVMMIDKKILAESMKDDKALHNFYKELTESIND